MGVPAKRKAWTPAFGCRLLVEVSSVAELGEVSLVLSALWLAYRIRSVQKFDSSDRLVDVTHRKERVAFWEFLLARFDNCFQGSCRFVGRPIPCPTTYPRMHLHGRVLCEIRGRRWVAAHRRVFGGP